MWKQVGLIFSNSLNFNYLLRVSNLLNAMTEKHYYVGNDIEKLTGINFQVTMHRDINEREEVLEEM